MDINLYIIKYYENQNGQSAECVQVIRAFTAKDAKYQWKQNQTIPSNLNRVFISINPYTSEGLKDG